MEIPERCHYLLELSDEQLVAIALRERNGHALAVLQERQCQDRLWLEEFTTLPLKRSRVLEAMRIFRRHQGRKRLLRKIQDRFCRREG